MVEATHVRTTCQAPQFDVFVIASRQQILAVDSKQFVNATSMSTECSCGASRVQVNCVHESVLKANSDFMIGLYTNLFKLLIKNLLHQNPMK